MTPSQVVFDCDKHPADVEPFDIVLTAQVRGFIEHRLLQMSDDNTLNRAPNEFVTVMRVPQHGVIRVRWEMQASQIACVLSVTKGPDETEIVEYPED